MPELAEEITRRYHVVLGYMRTNERSPGKAGYTKKEARAKINLLFGIMWAYGRLSGDTSVSELMVIRSVAREFGIDVVTLRNR